ncbi:unnamed protein product [Discula destructiva]
MPSRLRPRFPIRAASPVSINSESLAAESPRPSSERMFPFHPMPSTPRTSPEAAEPVPAQLDPPVIHAERPFWAVQGIVLIESRPHFSVGIGPVAWSVDEVIRIDAEGFLSYCHHFADWRRFMSERAHLLPYYPSWHIPGVYQRLEFLDMVLWYDRWMVVLHVDVLVDIRDVLLHEDLRHNVVQYLSRSDWVFVN